MSALAVVKREFDAYNAHDLPPRLRAEVINRMLLGGKVVDHERIGGLAKRRSKPSRCIATSTT